MDNDLKVLNKIDILELKTIREAETYSRERLMIEITTFKFLNRPKTVEYLEALLRKK